MTNEFIVFVELTSISKMTQELTKSADFRGKSAALLFKVKVYGRTTHGRKAITKAHHVTL
jgi:hypothetical protein